MSEKFNEKNVSKLKATIVLSALLALGAYILYIAL